MTPGESAAAKALRATAEAESRARINDDLTVRWFARMRNAMVEIDGRILKVESLATNAAFSGGWTEYGIWWNATNKSTFIRKWVDVLADLKP